MPKKTFYLNKKEYTKFLNNIFLNEDKKANIEIGKYLYITIKKKQLKLSLLEILLGTNNREKQDKIRRKTRKKIDEYFEKLVKGKRYDK
jgi:hypothetical protein